MDDMARGWYGHMTVLLTCVNWGEPGRLKNEPLSIVARLISKISEKNFLNDLCIISCLMTLLLLIIPADPMYVYMNETILYH